ncbi:hypothetical protein [Fenollaria massiliensis]|uniref:hypothetical protein n=1 Tax=Fenollaria massiliensis TaxID=938288 RepID=UPI0012B53C18|nr:hypothetical protein [Fenollaria massiliensis]
MIIVRSISIVVVIIIVFFTPLLALSISLFKSSKLLTSTTFSSPLPCPAPKAMGFSANSDISSVSPAFNSFAFVSVPLPSSAFSSFFSSVFSSVLSLAFSSFLPSASFVSSGFFSSSVFTSASSSFFSSDFSSFSSLTSEGFLASGSSDLFLSILELGTPPCRLFHLLF